MKINELTTPFNPFRVIVYNVDKTKVLYKNKRLQLVTGSIYRGETIEIGDGDRCDIYVCYPGVDVAMWMFNISTCYRIKEVIELVERREMDNLENFMEIIKYRLDRGDYFRLTEVEFVKHIAPELETQMWKSRKKYAEIQNIKRTRQEELDKAADLKFVTERNAEVERTVEAALKVLREGGKLENCTITYFRTRYDYSDYTVINYLMRKYGVKVPIRTQGWINEKLGAAIIKNGRCETVLYRKIKGAQCSQTVFGCLNKLIQAAANDDVTSANI